MNSLLSYALLTGVSVSYMSASRRLEHLRLVVSRRHVSTMLGIFTFAGVVVLPTLSTSLLVVTVYAALYAFHQWSARGTVEDTKAFDTVGGIWSEDAWLALAANAMDERKWFSVLIIDAGSAQFRETVVAELRSAGLIRDHDTVGSHADPAMIAVMLIDTPGAIARLLGRAMTAHLAQGGIQAAIGSADSRAESLHETVMHAYSDAIIQRAHSSSRAELL